MGKKTKKGLAVLLSALVACSALTLPASALNGKVSDETLDRWSEDLLSNEQNFMIQYLEDQPGWKKGYDIIEQSPWLYNPQTKMIFSYESERSLETRTNYIVDNDLGGCIAWDAQGDRIETFPMFDIMKTNLKDQGKDVVAYYGNWMAWGESDLVHTQGQYVEDLPWDQATCINYSFFGVSDGTIDAKHNSIAVPKYQIVTLNERLDFGTGDVNAVKAAKYGGLIESWSYDLLGKMAEQKALHPEVEVMLSVGGWSHSNLFHEMTSKEANRKIFIDSCVEFLKDFPHFDGIDIDWEYPSVAGSIPYGPEDKQNYVSLVKELREALDREFPNQEKRISTCAAATPVKHIGFDGAGIAKYVDRINVMSYNYNGDWSSVFKGYISPMFKDNASDLCTENIVEHLLSQGVDPNKINVGTPLYGFSYKNVSADANGNPSCLKNPMVKSMVSNDMNLDAGQTEQADASYKFTNNSLRAVSSLRNDVTAVSDNTSVVTTNVNRKTGEVTVTGVAGGTANVTVASPQDSISTTFAVTVKGETTTPDEPDEPTIPSQPSELSKNCVIGYWENWSGVNKMTLREIDPDWDVVIVSFMMLDSTNTKAVFTPDNAVYPGGDASFIEDIEFCQARGQKVLISFASSTGLFNLYNESEKEIFYDSSCEIIEKYGFDGIDIDLEAEILTVQTGDTLTETITPMQGYLDTILHDMVNKFGSDFMVTMAPVHPYLQGGAIYWGSADGSSGTRGAYLPLINNCRDILTFIHPQYYNNPITQYNAQWGACPDWGIEGYNTESLVKLSEVLIEGFETKVGFFEGLRPDQVAFGVPTYIEADGKGYLPFEDCAEALDILIKEYPTFRGIMAWSINKPDTNNGFVNSMQAVIDENNSTTPDEPDEPTIPSQPSELSKNCVIGYWENWSGVNKMTLREVDPDWDVIIVAFMLTDSSKVKVEFTPDSVVYPGGDYTFIDDVKFCQERGQKVLISLGGGAGEFELNSESEKEIFYDSACQIIEKYGFDGIDIDLEGSTVTVQSGDTLTDTITPVLGYLNTALHDMVNKFGSDFMLTMAPEHPYVQGGTVYWGSSSGASGFYGGYLPLINNCRDILTFIHPQYYNNPITQYNAQWWACPDWDIEGYNTESLVKLSQVLIEGFESRAGFFEGLRPDQVAFGVPTYVEADGRGYLPFEDCAEALDILIKQYPTFRGIMAWSINKPDTNDAFVNSMQAVIDENNIDEPTIPVEPLVISSLTPSIPTGVVDAGIDVTWTVTAKGGTQPYEYQYEIMFNNKVVDTIAYSTNSSVTMNLTDAGKHKVKITVKDADGTTVVRTSGVFTAEESVVTPPPATNTEYAMKLNEIYAYNNGVLEDTNESIIQGVVYRAKLQLDKGRTYLPARSVAQAIGLTVGYDASTSYSTVSNGTKTVKIVPNATYIIVVENGIETTVETGAAPIYVSGVTHIPVKAVIEQFGFFVNWHADGYLLITDYELASNDIDTLKAKVATML